MSFPGPLPISPINSPTDQSIGLRVNQRVTAQIISVTGTTAILEIDGHPVVAQLTSADQFSALSTQRNAQFIVTELTGQSLTLKFIKNEQAQNTVPGIVSSAVEIAELILENNNLPVTNGSRTVARSMLKQHLPFTTELLNELLTVLSEYGNWTAADADLASAMKAAGLPVTAQSLALASRQPAQTSQALSSLMTLLAQTSGQEIPEELLKQVNETLRELRSMTVRPGGDLSQLADQLKAAVEALGRSLENVLLEQSRQPQKPIPEKGLMSLVKLQHTLEEFGKRDAAASIRDFLTEVRLDQFMNVKPDAAPGQGEWAEIGFLIQSANQKADEKFSAARLRIARDAKKESNGINPGYTRLILQVDVAQGETVEVDLSLVGRQIRALVTGPDPAWCEQARVELPSLMDAMQELGYEMKDTQIGMGAPKPFNRIQLASGDVHLMTVNIEV